MSLKPTRCVRTSAIYLSVFVVAGMLAAGRSATPPNPSSAIENGDTYPSTGPSGGELIELGDREFYAELMIDEECHDVSIVILDKAAARHVPINAKVIFVNLKHQGKLESHRLVASPLLSDGDGMASRFVLKRDKHLHADLEQVAAEPRLEVKINGRVFSGKIPRHRKIRLRCNDGS